MPLHLLRKVYLIIDGGRFYSLGKVRSASHPFFAQTTIIGEYYVEEYLKRNSQFKPNSPVPFKPSPYCEQRKPRPFFSNEEVDEYHNSFTAWLNDGSHTVTTNQEPLSVSYCIVGYFCMLLISFFFFFHILALHMN